MSRASLPFGHDPSHIAPFLPENRVVFTTHADHYDVQSDATQSALDTAIARAIAGETPPEVVRATNQSSIESQAAQSLDQLRAYIALATPTAAQRLTFERLVARTLIGLIRLQLKQLEGTG